ncbi:serine/threonine-protein kinase [Kitasatospora sp. A2-31]|uniref:serine/threonine-protein kinase n=1 Tax=Kitasatospora sp. A2-31 TaxID=2916414 RepID=UPI001EEE96CF|nr:serine/threonine-protein kinase [Kitasatospora sp. A2-31]MCG6499820.1 protein kinase [Kitasatospora sp. A2-31]
MGEDRLITGRYRLLERIGSGGMGTVWRAEDELLGRDVAVKELRVRPELSPEETATLLERTRREARSAARINQRNVVVVHDVVEHEGLPCVVMEYVPSRTLAAVLAENGPLPAVDAARIGREILAGLRAAHAAGVVHRDVKPGNVLLALDGRIVLTDFGIATIAGTSSLTRTGELVGSVDYLAPELVRGGTPTPASDLWALGVTLYQAVEGLPPFRRATAIETAMAIAADPPEPPLHAGPLTPLIGSLLEKEPLERPTAEVAALLLEDTATGRTKPVDGAEHGPGLAVRSGGAPVHAATRPTAGGDVHSVAQPPGTLVTSGALAGDHLPATPAAGSAMRRTRRRTGLRWTVAASVTAAATAGVLVLAPGLHPRDHAARAEPAPSTAPSSPAGATGASSVGPAGPSPAASSPALPGGTDPVAAPAGSSIRRDPAGFSLAVPDGWVRSTDASGRVFYLSPDHAFRIGVHPTTPSGQGVLAELRKQDAAGPRTNPGYRGGSVEPTVFHGTADAALWLWTWNGYPEDGFGARHVQDISWTEQGRSYDFWVSAPTGRLDEANRYFQTVSATFRIG